MALDLSSMGILGSSGPKPIRPVTVGDTLSFNLHPDKYEDLMECNVTWKQGVWRSEKYMAFKAKNLTSGDNEALVSVFVQKSYYDMFSASVNDPVTFEITPEWQYGQLDKTGAGRFVVLHDPQNKPYQHRFVANLLVKLDNMVHDALCAAGHSEIADKLEDITETYFGEYLHSFYSGVVQSGDLLLVPSELKSYSFGNLKNITWWQTIFSRKRAEYYCFTVPNHTQKGLDVLFFIQKDWWDSDSTSENHISKIASKNEQGAYVFTVDEKSQYGQSDKSGKNRWVVYHDKKRCPYQHCFIKALLSNLRTPGQTRAVSGIFGLNIENDLEKAMKYIESWFGYYLHTFPK